MQTQISELTAPAAPNAVPRWDNLFRSFLCKALTTRLTSSNERHSVGGTYWMLIDASYRSVFTQLADSLSVATEIALRPEDSPGLCAHQPAVDSGENLCLDQFLCRIVKDLNIPKKIRKQCFYWPNSTMALNKLVA